MHRNQPQNPQKAGGFGILLELYKIILVFQNQLHCSKPLDQNDMSNFHVVFFFKVAIYELVTQGGFCFAMINEFQLSAESWSSNMSISSILWR